MHIYDHEGEPRYFGRYVATVIDNADPLKLGRVQFRIEGLIEPKSGWAFPVGGGGGGAAQRGSYDVPDKGATVLASFLAGDLDQPIFEGAWRGTSEGMTQLPSPADASKVKLFETSTWLVVLSDVGGSENLSLVHKGSGKQIQITPTTITIGDVDSAQPMLLAQTYRSGESTMNSAMVSAFTALATALAGNPSTEPAAAAAGATLAPLIAAINAFEGEASTFLSQVAKNS